MALIRGPWQVLWPFALFACDTQFADPIRQVSSPTPVDPCGAWVTASECLADAANGCSFQPNLVGCKVADPSCAPGECRGGDPFVRRSGETLWLSSEPFVFVGAVSWGIAFDPDGCSTPMFSDQDAALERTFDDLADMRADALKIWAFQDYAGGSGTDYSSFERVVAYARRAGVRLIFVLENMWGDCTRSERNDAWFAGGFREPYGGYALSYPDYVTGLVRHFRDEPTLLGWQLMHEAEGDDVAAMSGFASEMSTLVRSLDPNHLIALGVDNGSSPATTTEGQPSPYAELHALPAVDLLDVHDFSTWDRPLPAEFLDVRAVSAALRKPIYLGASAVTLGGTSGDAFAARASLVEQRIEAALEQGVAGFLVYDYLPQWQNLGWSFDARAGEPLAGPTGVIARHSRASR